jgi:hypothetical protein
MAETKNEITGAVDEEGNQGNIGVPDDDELDLEKFKLSQDFANTNGVKKQILAIPVVTKPDKQRFFRINPDPKFRMQAAILELKDDRELYLVTGSIADEIREEVKTRELYLGITRQGNLFVVCLRVPETNGGRRNDAWAHTALEGAKIAQSKWIRLVPNMEIGGYDVYEASGTIPEPQWPADKSFKQLLKIAFRGLVIDSLEHPAVGKLRGL